MVSSSITIRPTTATEGRYFRGIVGVYARCEQPSVGCVVVMVDNDNARAAHEMGFQVSSTAEADGYRAVYCPGDPFPCWDVARQLAGRPVYVSRDADGYSVFKLVRPRMAV